MSETRGLDRICAERAAAVFGERANEADVRPACRAAVAAVLAEQQLDAEEAAALAQGEGSDAGLLQLRLRRAMRAGIEAAAEVLGEPAPPEPPPVAVVLGPSPETASRLASSAGRVGTSGTDASAPDDSAGPAHETGHGLVLADGEGYEGLRAAVGEVEVETSGTESAVFRGDALDDSTSASGAGLEVFQAAGELSELAQRMRAASTRTGAEDDSTAAPRSAPESDELGDRLLGQVLGGKYRIDSVLGEGGFGTVYVATDMGLDTPVAVKVLKRETSSAPGALADFLGEAKLLTKLDHPNIVRWITFSETADGLHYFVMEYLRGEELAAIMKREGPMDSERAIELLLQVLAALKRAHHLPQGQALLHLDLKPQNVFVVPPAAEGEDEQAKVIDFGIGQHIGAEARTAQELPAPDEEDTAVTAELERSIAVGGSTSTRLVRTPDGRTVRRARGGTLLYASPEQCKHLAGHKDIVELDGRSDLYSFGILAFQVLTGKYPFRKPRSVKAAIKNHLEVAPITVLDTGVKVPKRLARFVDRCLVKDRDERWASTREAYAALNRIAHPERSLLMAVVPTVLVAAAFATWIALSGGGKVADHRLLDSSGASVPELWSATSRVVHELSLGNWSGESARLVLRDDAGDVDPGWDAQWTDAEQGRFELFPDAEQPPRPGTRTVSLEVERDASVVGRTQLFTLHVIPDWEIAEVGVVGRKSLEQLLDPVDQVLRLRAAPTDATEEPLSLSSFTVRTDRPVSLRSTGTGELPVEASGVLESGPQDWPEGSAAAELDLGFLAVLEGPVALDISAIDKAGRTHSWSEPFGLQLAGPPPALAEDTGFIVLDGSGGEVFVAGRGAHASLGPDHFLRIRSSSPAWAEVDVTGGLRPRTRTFGLEQRSSGAVAKAAFEVRIPLADLGAETWGGQGGEVVSGKLVLRLGDRVQRSRAVSEELELPFYFYPGRPELSAEWVPLTASETDAPDTVAFPNDQDFDKPLYRSSSAARLELRNLGTERPLAVGLSIRGEGEGAGRELFLERKPLGSTSPTKFELPELEDGLWELRIEVLEQAEEGSPEPDDESTSGVVVATRSIELTIDSVDPVVSWSDASQNAGTNGAEVPNLQLDWGASSYGGVHALSWVLTRNGGERVEAGDLDPRESSDGAVRDWEKFRGSFLPDGFYALAVVARDRAGNSTELTREWVVSREAPLPNLVEPRKARGQWKPRSGFWPLEVAIEEGDRVERAEVRFENLDTQTVSGPHLLVRKDGEQHWSLRDPLPLNHRWSGAEVTVAVSAVDVGGNLGEEAWTARMGEIAPDYDQIVALAGTTGPRSVLVLGEADRRALSTSSDSATFQEASYRRADEDRAQPASYWGATVGRGAETRFWSPPGAAERLDTYYLDERVVNAAEFLAFLEAASGWGSPEHWPAGRIPNASRRANLRSALEGVDAEAPATGVGWSEATAYARWVDKRLPTLLELDEGCRRHDDPDELDLGALEHLAGTLDGLEEWTSTPMSFVPSQRGRVAPRTVYAELLDWFLAPPDLRCELDWWSDAGADVARIAYTRGAKLLELRFRAPDGAWLRAVDITLPPGLETPISIGALPDPGSAGTRALGATQPLVVYGFVEGDLMAWHATLVLDAEAGWQLEEEWRAMDLAELSEPVALPTADAGRYWVSGRENLTLPTGREPLSSARLLPADQPTGGVGFRCALSGLELMARHAIPAATGEGASK